MESRELSEEKERFEVTEEERLRRLSSSYSKDELERMKKIS